MVSTITGFFYCFGKKDFKHTAIFWTSILWPPEGGVSWNFVHSLREICRREPSRPLWINWELVELHSITSLRPWICRQKWCNLEYLTKLLVERNSEGRFSRIWNILLFKAILIKIYLETNWPSYFFILQINVIYGL